MREIFRAIREFVRKADMILLALCVTATVFGIVVISSATNYGGSARYVRTQTLALILGIAVYVVLTLIDVDIIAERRELLLIFSVLFIGMLKIWGVDRGGNKSWLRFGGIGIQPAELGKLLFIFTFAKHINLLRYRLNRVRSLLMLGAHLLAIMAAIILPSHDVGMSLPYVFIAVLMLFSAGLSLKWFAGGAILACAAVPILWQVLSSIQKNRILVLFDPTIAPDTYWQQEQSRIAIGSGKLFGTGFLQGNQTQNNMLPEKQTDFIFGVAGEEWGLVGCMVIVIALMALIFRTFFIAYHAHGQISSLICVGVGSMMLFQTYENIFMCLGIGPVMGLTLPFFSYGGSSIATMYLALGMVVSVSRREKKRRLKGLPAGEHLVSEEAERLGEKRSNETAVPLRQQLQQLGDRAKDLKSRVKIDWVPQKKKKDSSGKRDENSGDK